MAHRRVFLDANVVIEAFRISVWTELAAGHWLETVEEVVRESLTGDSDKYGRVAVDPKALNAGLKAAHQVTRKEKNALIDAHRACTGMDPGEKDLFAHLFANQPQPLSPLIVVNSADKGVVVRAKDLGWLHNLVSLEELLQACGVARSKMALLDTMHHDKFLSEVRTKVLLGVIP